MNQEYIHVTLMIYDWPFEPHVLIRIGEGQVTRKTYLKILIYNNLQSINRQYMREHQCPSCALELNKKTMHGQLSKSILLRFHWGIIRNKDDINMVSSVFKLFYL